jgi:putative glycosyltransferase (TIGR04372 family)
VGLGLGTALWSLSRYRPVQVQQLVVARIGHLAIEPGLFLGRRSLAGSPRGSVWFFAEGPVCNEALLEKWRQILPIGPAGLLGPIYRASRRFRWLGLHPLDWPSLSHSDFRSLDGRTPWWSFNDSERALGEALVRELRVPEGRPYVCLAIRDGAYLRATDTSRNWDYSDYRDSQISDYGPMSEKLVERGYAVLRMGRIVESALLSKSPEVIDYANSPLRSDFADLWLFANCAFCISTSTGMDALASTQLRPMGRVNISTSASLIVGEMSKLVMFKDLVDLRNGEVLKLLDDRRPAAMGFTHISQLTDMGLALRDNSPADLEAFANEMVDLLEGHWQPTAEQVAVEKKFLSLLRSPPDLILTEASFHISPAWLQSRS